MAISSKQASLDDISTDMQELKLGSIIKTVPVTLPANVPFTATIGPRKLDMFKVDGMQIQFDNVKCRHFYDDLRTRQDLQMNLMENFGSFLRKDYSKLKLGDEIFWLKETLRKRPDITLKEAAGNAEFFTGLEVLLKVGCTPFTLYPWKIVWIQYKDVVFAVIDSSSTTDLAEAEYMAHKFKQCVTVEANEKTPRTSRPVNTHEQYRAMHKVTLQCGGQKLGCVYTSVVDCVGQDGQHIQLKTEPGNVKPSPYLAKKYAMWWLQCELGNCAEVIIGRKTEQRYAARRIATVDSLRSIQSGRLPYEADGHLYWKPNDELYFMHHFLSELKAVLDQQPDGTIVSGELASARAEAVVLRIEPAGTSKYDILRQELEDLLANYL